MISAISSYGLFSTWRRMTAVLYSGRQLEGEEFLLRRLVLGFEDDAGLLLALGVGGVG
jgi:hypothetical protein